ncbi:hypothetical protein Phum_PHUM247690 [Pediculus humanus corporis]|uniref:Uncharacterized protein n=1 Tax=Pediculus humanus subsp. corporis TaxID=121224 RepID=E0VJL0_PEDHC|nr:uncharacterized protein Phum_PHUM247690 [Pediculus humanus corporis]EEB13566.1 hypothetical protein Phum_PHUM247690 [Pediculus humanus corporis]
MVGVVDESITNYQSDGNVRSNSSSNSGSSPTINQGSMLIVPQPINATKNGSTHGNTSTGGGGGGRKYNCKMCPQKRDAVVDIQKENLLPLTP